MGSTCLFCGIFEYPRGSPLASEVLTLLSKNTCEPIWPQTFFPPPPKSPKYPNKTRRAISKFLVEILTELLTPRRATSHVLSLEAPYPSRSRAQLCFQTQGIRDQPVKVADPLFLRPKVSKCAIPWSRLRRVGHQTLQPWVPVFGCLAWCLQGVELRFLRCKLLGACQRESLNALASTQPLRNPGASQILHIRR